MMAVAFMRPDKKGKQETERSSENVITLKGATQFDEDHAFTRTIRKFEELVTKYYGKPVIFELYLNSELGLEKDYFTYMSQGNSVDYGIVSPSHMSNYSPAAPLMDMPFLSRRFLFCKLFLSVQHQLKFHREISQDTIFAPR